MTDREARTAAIRALRESPVTRPFLWEAEKTLRPILERNDPLTFDEAIVHEAGLDEIYEREVGRFRRKGRPRSRTPIVDWSDRTDYDPGSKESGPARVNAGAVTSGQGGTRPDAPESYSGAPLSRSNPPNEEREFECDTKSK